MFDLVSIIVPVYNVEKYLENCIDSILKQTYSELEIILIDDGSIDNSGKICDKKSQEDERIIVYHKKNEGVSVARNYGIERATGKFIMFVDSDDMCDEHMVEKLLTTINHNNSDMVVCGIKVFNESTNGNRNITYESRNIDIKEYVNDILLKVTIGQYCGGPYNKLFKKEIIDKYNIRFNTGINYAEDFCFNMAMLKFVKSISICSDELYKYREGTPNSLTFQNWHKISPELFWKQRLFAYKEYEEVFIKYGLFELHKAQISRLLMSFAISAIKMVCKYSVCDKYKTINYIEDICSNELVRDRISYVSATGFGEKFRVKLIKSERIKCLYCLEKTRYKIGGIIAGKR